MQNQELSRQDQAVADRLHKLASVPVDLSRLEKQLGAQIPRQKRRVGWSWWFGPVAAIAASVAVALFITGIWFGSSGQVMASPAQMARFHQDIIDNKIPVTRVDSIEQAGKVLAEQWPQGPDLPRAPEAHVMACCMKSVGNKKVACVLLSSEGMPITMSVANASDMKSPRGRPIVRDGARFHLESTGSLNMISTERNGRWVCLIGDVAPERLVTIAQQLQF